MEKISNLSNILKTATQRRVILIEITDQETEIDLENAVKNAMISAMRSEPPFPFNVLEYSKFSLYRARD